MFSRCKPTQHYYETCQHCGNHLDPGEQCDCERNDKNVKTAGTNRNQAPSRQETGHYKFS